MQAGSIVGEEGCNRCKEVSSGSVAFFCPACGRQIKPIPEGTFAFRAAEGSAEKAWKSFGFADAHAPSKRARSVMAGNESARRAASLAFAATISNIERTVAPPTLEQARVMGVESVVEGVDWELSTDQLQVLALARSGALRGRRRVPNALRQPSPATPIAAVTTKKESPKRRKSKGKPRGGRVNPGKQEPIVNRTRVGNEQQRRGISAKRSSGRRGSDDVPRLLPTADPAKKGAKSSTTTSPDADCASSSVPSVLKRQRHRTEAEETREQLVAVARGGVRYAGKVFHRRGVKLTEDSPRSMVPRDAFRAPGLHLLGQKELLVGRGERQRILVAELSAVVRAVPVDTEKAVGLAEDTTACRRSGPSPSNAQSSFACDGVRLEMRPPRRRSQALQCECASPLAGGLAKIQTAASETIAAFRDESRGSGGSRSGPLEEVTPCLGIEEDCAAHSGDLLPPGVPPSRPATSTAGLADRQHHRSAASADGECHQRGVPTVFSQDFTHLELDALLGPTLCWEDPFEEDTKTVGGLQAGWTACLNSLCGRLRATVPEVDVDRKETDGGKPPSDREGEITPKDATETTVIAEKMGALPASTNAESRGKTEGRRQDQCVEEGPAAITEVERRGSPVAPVATGDTTVLKKGQVADVPVSAGDDVEARARAVQVQALPLVRMRRRRTPGGKLEEVAGETGVWFDRTIVRVGARVPWGRLHRGRFAKVLFTVSLGEDGNGLDFAATSNSPTADPMLRGRWDFRATDRDIARYLSSGYAVVNGANLRGRARSHTYDPRRCVGELQERGELSWACAVVARTAFRLVMVVPGGVVLSLAGVAVVGGREVAWPQDIEEDKVLYKASSDIQRAWRGCTCRKRVRWLRMEREGRRRLSRMRKEAEDERERTRLLEQEEARAKLALEKERRTTAQIVLAAAARRLAARRETSRRRAKQASRQRQLEEEAAATREEAEKVAAAADAARSPLSLRDDDTGEATTNEAAVPEPLVDDDHEDSTHPGVARLERVVTIDGTEVHLTAHVKEGASDGADGEETDQPMEMLLVAVDKKARRSSRLSLDAADVREIIGYGSHQDGEKGGDAREAAGPRAALSAVLKKLTLFNSRRKDLFILSYRGKKVVAPH
eukprot:g8321.t1